MAATNRLRRKNTLAAKLSRIEQGDRMRIGYLIPEFPGQTHAFFMREKRALQNHGVETKLLSTRPPASGLATHTWAEKAIAETTYLTPMTGWQIVTALLEFLRCGPGGWIRCLSVVLLAIEISVTERCRLFAMMLVAASYCRMARRQNLRHLHIHSCANAAWVGVFAHMLRGIEYSLTLHGPLEDYGPNQSIKWQHASFVVIITTELVRQATSKLPQEMLPPLVLAPMGVDTQKFRRLQEYQPPRPDTPVRLVSCGRLNPCKGHDDLIHVVQMLRQRGVDAQLNICGAADSCQPDYAESLRTMIEDFKLQNCVRLLGSVSEETVRQELAEAHIFCLASHREPLGVATMEAMAMGLPVIVTASPGVREMIQDCVDGILVRARTPEDFVDRICELIGSPDTASGIGRRGRRTVETRFHSGVSAEAIAEQLRGGQEDTDLESTSQEGVSPDPSVTTF